MKFDNPYLFVAAVLVVYESSLLIGPVGLNHNSYKDVLQLTVGSTSALMPFVSFRKTGEVAYRESVGSVWQGIFLHHGTTHREVQTLHYVADGFGHY